MVLETEIIRLSKCETDEEEKKFLDLLNEFQHKGIERSEAKLLMKTFQNGCITSIQESVIRVLTSGGDELYMDVMLEELPRISREAPEWLDALLATEVEHKPDFLVHALEKKSEEIKKLVLDTIQNKDFIDFTPNAISVIKQIEASE
jgi:hypothetical protein